MGAYIPAPFDRMLYFVPKKLWQSLPDRAGRLVRGFDANVSFSSIACFSDPYTVSLPCQVVNFGEPLRGAVLWPVPLNLPSNCRHEAFSG